jgi:hypothetical protein
MDIISFFLQCEVVVGIELRNIRAGICYSVPKFSECGSVLLLRPTTGRMGIKIVY